MFDILAKVYYAVVMILAALSAWLWSGSMQRSEEKCNARGGVRMLGKCVKEVK